jgi:hypothetical protein
LLDPVRVDIPAHDHDIDDLARHLAAVEDHLIALLDQAASNRLEGDDGVDATAFQRGLVLRHLNVDQFHFFAVNAADLEQPVQHQGAERGFFQGDGMVLEPTRAEDVRPREYGVGAA